MKRFTILAVFIAMVLGVSAQYEIHLWMDGVKISYPVLDLDSITFTNKEIDEPETPTAGIGVFSVGEGKTVTFSPGNLQYTQSTATWSFANAQWEVLGTDNVVGGSVTSDATYGDSKSGTALADKIEFFGWSTTANTFGVSTSTDNNDYSGSFVDWGTNQIGADAPNTWRTLSSAEWHYLRNTRPNASALCGAAQVNGVNGLILLPDNWTCPADVNFIPGFHSNLGVEYFAEYQTFTAAQWAKLESAGAVFLPAAGGRGGSNVASIQGQGLYWSSSEYSNDATRAIIFMCASNSAQTRTANDYRYFGRSVRLVKDIQGGSTPETPGANLTAPIIHDFSVTTENVYPDFTTLTEGAHNTRGSDFDGEYVLIVSRADAETPTHHLLKVSDLLNDNINKIELSKEGVEGGTHVVSSGCLSHGHIYVCNLSTNLGNGEDLKVYHYASPDAAPDVWSWDGILGTDEYGDPIHSVYRLGDNISVNLDESGNGYAFFCGMEVSAERMYRVEIANFNEFSNPTEIILDEAFPFYGYVNQVDDDLYLLTSHYMASTWLIDKDGTLITDIFFQRTASGLKPQTGVDPHVVKFNNGYYLIFASPYNNAKRLGVGPALYMVDITEGSQVNIAKGLQDLSDELWEDEEGIWEPDYHYSLDQANIEAETHKTVAACAAQCNAAVVDGKLLVYAAAVGAGFVIIEFPAAK